jgi:hypothetical protein
MSNSPIYDKVKTEWLDTIRSTERITKIRISQDLDAKLAEMPKLTARQEQIVKIIKSILGEK